MSQKKPDKKKIVKTVPTSSKKKKVSPTASKKSKASSTKSDPEAVLLFGKQNFQFMLIGLAIIILGFVLMAGGENAPDSWDENKIYAFRRITLAPLVVLIGLGVEIYAIFKR